MLCTSRVVLASSLTVGHFYNVKAKVNDGVSFYLQHTIPVRQQVRFKLGLLAHNHAVTTPSEGNTIDNLIYMLATHSRVRDDIIVIAAADDVIMRS